MISNQQNISIGMDMVILHIIRPMTMKTMITPNLMVIGMKNMKITLKLMKIMM